MKQGLKQTFTTGSDHMISSKCCFIFTLGALHSYVTSGVLECCTWNFLQRIKLGPSVLAYSIPCWRQIAECLDCCAVTLEKLSIITTYRMQPAQGLHNISSALRTRLRCRGG